MFLPKLCEAQGVNSRRGMAEIRSSDIVAPGPVRSVKLAAKAPEPDPQSVMLIAEPVFAPAPY